MAINVTKTYLPNLDEYCSYLKKIWESGQVTNHGPFVTQLENELKKYLGVKHLFCTSNATVGLQIAIKALSLSGEIITTPFSYVATTSVIKWEGCEPKYVDIDADTLCLDPQKISDAITKRTTAIFPVHVYGNACNVDAIADIARKYKLKVLYDAAHSFATQLNDRSILEFGDISVLSFHATKLFHTVEGGAIVTSDDQLAHRISYMRNFGHKGPEDFYGLGINGKMSELHAAMGLCLLPKMPAIIKQRQHLSSIYDSHLSYHPNIRRPGFASALDYNYAYYPIILNTEEMLLRMMSTLNQNQIFPRRYFYPALNKLNYVESTEMPIAEDIASKVLCLPLAAELSEREVESISQLVISALDSAAPSLHLR